MENRQAELGTFARLSGMMFLQFAIWGAWAVLIAGHMQNLGFTGKQISYVFGTTAIGSIISPIIAGWGCGSTHAGTSICRDLASPWGDLSAFRVEADKFPDDVGRDFPACHSLYGRQLRSQTRSPSITWDSQTSSETSAFLVHSVGLRLTGS